METLKKNAANLLKVKTIVTLALTLVFCILALSGAISSGDFMTVFTVVIAFYFGTQAEKLAAGTANTYAGTQQAGETVQETVQHIAESVDDAQVQAIHPPDNENTKDVTVTGFAG